MWGSNAVGAGMLAALVGAAGAGCATVRLDFQTLPPESALLGVEAGVTTRDEVLRLLGPPEEMRRLSPFERARADSPQARRILEAGEVFGAGVYTYATEADRIDRFGFLPFGPALFRVSWSRAHERRWSIEFDEAGVVSSVSRVDESDAID
jgi:hypothetical protein